jgi:hypothetical protein
MKAKTVQFSKCKWWLNNLASLACSFLFHLKNKTDPLFEILKFGVNGFKMPKNITFCNNLLLVGRDSSV